MAPRQAAIQTQAHVRLSENVSMTAQRPARGFASAVLAGRPRNLRHAIGTGLRSYWLFHKRTHELAPAMHRLLEKHPPQERLDAAFRNSQAYADLFIGKPFQD